MTHLGSARSYLAEAKSDAQPSTGICTAQHLVTAITSGGTGRSASKHGGRTSCSRASFYRVNDCPANRMMRIKHTAASNGRWHTLLMFLYTHALSGAQPVIQRIWPIPTNIVLFHYQKI